MSTSPAQVPVPTRQRRLDSWKQIAGYLNKSIKTVRRWERLEGLPVHKHPHLQRSSIFAYEEEIDAWLEQRRKGPVPLQDAPPPVVSKRALLWSAAGVGALAALLTWMLLPRAADPVELRSEPFTALPGEEYHATFSPDGEAVAFFWQHPEEDKIGIYRKPLGSKSDDVTPLMVTPNEVNFSPSWSPDGRWIAYVRKTTAGECWLRLMAADGTSDRAITRVGPSGMYPPHVLNMSWEPGSRWLMVRFAGNERTIRRVLLDGSDVVVLRAPSVYSPALSPDGRTLMFQRRQGVPQAGDSEVLLQPLDGEGLPVGQPKVIYHTAGGTRGVAWSPGGKDIVMCAVIPGGQWRLFRVALDGSTDTNGPVTPLLDQDCATVSISRPDSAGNAILLYGGASQARFTRLWESSLDRLEEKLEFAPASRASHYPRFSPDGSAIAFVSERSGQPEVWRAQADGSHPVRLTTDSRVESEPDWSRDGRQLVYTSGKSKPSSLEIVSAEGGAATLVNTGGQYSSYGFWSRSSALLYFGTPRQLWQVRPDGSERRLLHDGHLLFYAAESPDGRFVYLTRLLGLHRVSLADGSRELVHDLLATPRTSATARSLYFVSEKDRALHRLPLSGGTATRLGVLPAFAKDANVRLTNFGFTVSPDEKRIVWAEQDPQIDLEMIRDFR